MPRVREIEVVLDEVMDANLRRLGHYTNVIFTSHRTNSNSLTSRFAHTVVELFPEKYVEVADKKGVPCPQAK